MFNPRGFLYREAAGKNGLEAASRALLSAPRISNGRVSDVENTTVRLRKIERQLEELFPGLWKRAERTREKRAKKLPLWCYLPVGAWMTAALETKGAGEVFPRIIPELAGAFSAVGTWRTTKGIYRFDPDLLSEIIDTPVEGDIPCEVLKRLPEWCVYVETPGYECDGVKILGFFAHVEEDELNGDEELRLLIVTEDDHFPQVVHLGKWSLDDGLRLTVETCERNLGEAYPPEERTRMMNKSRRLVEPLLSLLLYLCSANAEIGSGSRKPRTPKPVRASNGKKKILAAGNTRIWDVGERVGAAIRRGREAAYRRSVGGTSEREGSSKRPHVRRAHWHGYWHGPREGDRVFGLVWIPPTHVKINASAAAESLPTVGRAVEEGRRSA